jgi:hypothetical protein
VDNECVKEGNEGEYYEGKRTFESGQNGFAAMAEIMIAQN